MILLKSNSHFIIVIKFIVMIKYFFFRFNENIINVLITSEVLEEGVDIQTCNYVIRYDCPKNFPSYVQSKGRARSNDSNFIVMVPNKIKFEQTHLEYVKIEEEINKVCL